MLNSAIMTGRMVADPELKTTQSNVSVTSFRIAVTRNYKANDEYPTDFFNVVAWRNTAEFVTKHFRKGDLLTVQGRMEVRKYTDRDGNNREAVELVADSVYFCEKKRSDNNGNGDFEPMPVEDDFEPIADEFPDFPG